MDVLILGGTGLTGPYVVRRLHALGHRVTVFHRGMHQAELPRGVHELHGAGLPDLEISPDVVVHMRALTEDHASAFLGRFRNSAGRAVVISSCDVYRAYGALKGLESAPPHTAPLTEESPLRQSRFPYAGAEGYADYDKVLVEQ